VAGQAIADELAGAATVVVGSTRVREKRKRKTTAWSSYREKAMEGLDGEGGQHALA
jgi:hypothetical protein